MSAIYKYLFYSLAFLAAGLVFQSCKAEGEDVIKGQPGDPVVFTGEVVDEGLVKTRVNSSYITSDPFNMDFFIQMCYDDNNSSTFATYKIPSGFAGRLDPIDEANQLDWQNLNTPHVFYSWNVPWRSDYEPKLTDDSNVASVDTLNINFYNSVGTEGFAIAKNNNFYENFIGAKSDPVSYVKNGKYVDLTFFHLVSKIYIRNFVLIETNGAIQENLKADMTFIGMPTKAVFYPHPPTGIPVVKEPESSPDDGVTYYIDNSATAPDMFYICPEVDFSEIDYMIKLKSADYKDYDTYYGNFSEVNFIREGEDYDKGDGSDYHTLHAGEMMTLDITLIPGKGPGLSVIISNWSTDEPQDAQYHTKPGIYSEAELQSLVDLFMALKSVNDTAILDQIRMLFDIYGLEEDDIKYFMLFENLDLSYTNIFPIWKEYVFNGLGHTVTIKTNYGNAGNEFGSSQTYYNIGPCRDIYFTDPNGNNTIYIDPDGYVWITNKTTGELERTENQLQDLQTYGGGKYNSYDISAETGQIRYSEYFNGTITG